jgi:hypothetical protein
MKKSNLICFQDEGLIFLWVTGRAMELGRECLKLWGYERVDEIIWVKTNQLVRLSRVREPNLKCQNCNFYISTEIFPESRNQRAILFLDPN